MTVDKSDARVRPVPPAPFALIVGSAMRQASADALEQAIRQIGLRPERIDGDSPGLGPPAFRLRFGALSWLAGPADEEALDQADPAHPSTNLLAASLPRDWRDGRHCWTFVPDDAEAQDGAAVPSMSGRDYFNVMLLLIDLFDASHLFWSPAHLWSDAPQFRASVAEMLTSGMPPVLHLVAFRRHDSQDSEAVGTRGLTWFAGQELEAAIPAGWTVAEMVKRLARLAVDMMLHGRFSGNRDLQGLEPGETIRLSAVGGDRRVMRVEFGRES